MSAEVDRLRAEVAELRGELAAMRADLAREIRTQHIVVDDGGDRETTIHPGIVSVSCEGAATMAGMSADWEEANVHAWSSLAAVSLWPEGEPEPEHHAAQLVATNPLGEPRSARLEVVGGQERQQRATVSSGRVHVHDDRGDVHASLGVDEGLAAVSVIDYATTTATATVSTSGATTATIDLNGRIIGHDAEQLAGSV